MEKDVGILGLYGMGGIGKTTILKQINKKLLEKKEDEFGVVIFVVVSQNLQVGKIQNEISERLGLCDMAWEKKTQKEKASRIYDVLRRTRFVMLLDDIWRKVDIEDEIGIPLPSPENGSKVVFTTRSKYVCGRMGPHDVEVKQLDPENAWELFRQKVRGLPLALNVIGETMTCKTTVREWQWAIDVLNTNAAKYSEVEDEILKVLKLSYDDLKDETVQECFQYCALFPEDNKIEKDVLVEYWISEGIINGGGDKERATNQGAGLHQMPQVRDWKAVRRMSLANNEIKNISISPVCPNLTTLLLAYNNLVNISGEFFLSMPNLVILDLCSNKNLTKLPEEVSSLVSLRYLDLSRTRLENLPVGFGKLIQLRYLDLSDVQTLQSISVVSSLVNIEILLLDQTTFVSLELIEDIKLLENLKGLGDLSWLIFAVNLTFVLVHGPSPELQEIVSREKVSCKLNKGSSIEPFRKLHTIHLSCLTELKSIYWERLELPSLKRVIIKHCPKLKKLPFNKERAYYFDLHVEKPEWFERLEWEDEATEE
ncbi:BnaUnng00640D [Brassica napus]|uniref:BnaUnng00640D protein n=1 Tax=Brassica napus TaxID=3708 RepID=A0A078J7K9_BRANA|nr:BnaUnng00640D [Brassica napus]